MLIRPLKLLVFLLGLGTAAYGLFFVPLGDRTLFEHLQRIAETDEAKELSEDLDDAADEAADDVAEKLKRIRQR